MLSIKLGDIAIPFLWGLLPKKGNSNYGEILITLSNKYRKTALDWYQKRWFIETLFENMKTRGFRLEDTHITAQDKLKSLVCVLTLAFWMCNLQSKRNNRTKSAGV